MTQESHMATLRFHVCRSLIVHLIRKHELMGYCCLPAAWHQWLRYTRAEPPSIQEQQLDVQRQSQLKVLAQRADERWASKPSMLDKPRRGNTELGVGDGESMGTIGRQGETGVGEGTVPREEREKQGEQDVKKMAKGKNPGEGWQPESWSPGRMSR